MNPGLVPPPGMRVWGLFCCLLCGCLGSIPAPAPARRLLGAGRSAAQLPEELLSTPKPSSSVLPNPKGVFPPPRSCPSSPPGAPRNSSGMLGVPGYRLWSAALKKRICVLRERSAGTGIALGPAAFVGWIPAGCTVRPAPGKPGVAGISPGHSEHPGSAGAAGMGRGRSQGKAGCAGKQPGAQGWKSPAGGGCWCWWSRKAVPFPPELGSVGEAEIR